MPGYSTAIYDFRTGFLQAPVTPATFSAERKLNASGTGSATFRYPDYTGFVDYVQLTQMWKRVFVVFYNSAVVYAGLITNRSDDGKGTITINYSDFRSITARRTTNGEDGYTRANYTDTLNNYSYANIIALLLRLTVQGPAANWAMPFVYPIIDTTDTAGTTPIGLLAHDGSFSRVYYDYEGHVIEATITELQNTEGGPDTDYVPSLVGGILTHTARIGTAAAPQLSGPLFEFNMSVPETGLLDVTYAEDGSLMATDVTMMGKGSGLIRPYGVARVDNDLPALAVIKQDTSLETDDQAAEHARALLAAYSTPTVQWTASMHADGSPDTNGNPTGPLVSDLQLGATFRLRYAQQRGLIAAGVHDLRMIGFTVDQTNTVKLSIQPVGA